MDGTPSWAQPDSPALPEEMLRHDDYLESLWMGPTVYSQLGMHASGQRDREVCGVMFGHRVIDQGVKRGLVLGCARLANVAEDPTSAYRFDPDQQAATWRQVRAMRLEVLGVWHSHPTGPPHPSQTDVEYMQPWLAYVILVPGAGRVEMTCYRLVAEPDRSIGYTTVLHEVRMTGVGGPTGPGRRPV